MFRRASASYIGSKLFMPWQALVQMPGLRVTPDFWYTMAIFISTNPTITAPCALSSLAQALRVQQGCVPIRGYVQIIS